MATITVQQRPVIHPSRNETRQTT